MPRTPPYSVSGPPLRSSAPSKTELAGSGSRLLILALFGGIVMCSRWITRDILSPKAEPSGHLRLLVAPMPSTLPAGENLELTATHLWNDRRAAPRPVREVTTFHSCSFG